MGSSRLEKFRSVAALAASLCLMASGGEAPPSPESADAQRPRGVFHAIEAQASWAEARLARALTEMRARRKDSAAARTGLFMFDSGGWRRRRAEEALPADLVLLVHGLDEPGDIWSDLAPALADAGLAVTRFDYPNDQAVVRSADLLAASLRAMKAHGAQRVSIVAHSMGGLVSRETLSREGVFGGADTTNEPADFPDIPRLLMCGTPNTGASSAVLQPLSELRERIVRLAHGDCTSAADLFDLVSDGAGEAARDLAVGSSFLEALNARPHPPGVTITCIVAELAPAERNLLDDLLESPRITRWLGSARSARLQRIFRMARNEIGDGLVPVASARLKGVDDVVFVYANHRTMLMTLPGEAMLSRLTGQPVAPPPAIREIIARLAGRHE